MHRSAMPERNLSRLVVPRVGRLARRDDPWMPYVLLDASGDEVKPVTEYFKDLRAADRAVGTLYSYGNDLLRWWRFLGAVGMSWERATRDEARDFTGWLQEVRKTRLSAPGPGPVAGPPAKRPPSREGLRPSGLGPESWQPPCHPRGW